MVADTPDADDGIAEASDGDETTDDDAGGGVSASVGEASDAPDRPGGPPDVDAPPRLAGLPLDAWTVGPLFARGVVTAVGSYLLLVALLVVGPSTLGKPSVELFVNIAEVFYSAHNISSVAPEVTYNAIVRIARLTGTRIPVPVYFALPLVPLLAAGLELGANHVDVSVPRQQLVAATFVFAVGYTTALLAGTLPFRIVSVHPSYFRTVVFGMAYPGIFTLVGAMVGRAIRESA